jgi:site-specific recombinase XerD
VVTRIPQDRAQTVEAATFSPHDLRRSWISTQLDAGADLVTVADLAGHANIATTAKGDMSVGLGSSMIAAGKRTIARPRCS